MARERISEYTAKRLLLGDAYEGITVSGKNDAQWDTFAQGAYVAKVDQGVKKRFLNGLVVVNVSREEAQDAIVTWEGKGYTQFLIEKFVPHDAKDERYISFERVRDGVRVLFVNEGGVEVESAKESLETFLLSDKDAVKKLVAKGIQQQFIDRVHTLIREEYVSFIEINPLLITPDGLSLLDAAVLVDGAGTFFAHAWGENDIVHLRSTYPEEVMVQNLQRTTAASLKLSVINPDGALFFLLSGGGGSIVALDAVHAQGAGAQIGNYGEYSGGPTREETYLYTTQVLSLMLRSKAPRKALVIAGGVANFTDIVKTFQGVIDALREVAQKMRDAGIKVFVRRGGPNESAGLRAMEEFLKDENIFGSVYGSESTITKPVIEATNFVTQKT